MEPAGVVGSSSMMDSGVWPEALQHRQPPPFTPCQPSSVLESGATCELPADSGTSALHAIVHVVGRLLSPPSRISHNAGMCTMLMSMHWQACIILSTSRCMVVKHTMISRADWDSEDKYATRQDLPCVYVAHQELANIKSVATYFPLACASCKSAVAAVMTCKTVEIVS